jgi:hypothetical protein
MREKGMAPSLDVGGSMIRSGPQGDSDENAY